MNKPRQRVTETTSPQSSPNVWTSANTKSYPFPSLAEALQLLGCVLYASLLWSLCRAPALPSKTMDWVCLTFLGCTLLFSHAVVALGRTIGKTDTLKGLSHAAISLDNLVAPFVLLLCANSFTILPKEELQHFVIVEVIDVITVLLVAANVFRELANAGVLPVGAPAKLVLKPKDYGDMLRFRPSDATNAGLANETFGLALLYSIYRCIDAIEDGTAESPPPGTYSFLFYASLTKIGLNVVCNVLERVLPPRRIELGLLRIEFDSLLCGVKMIGEFTWVYALVATYYLDVHMFKEDV